MKTFDPQLVKQKVNETHAEVFDLISKKAIELGIEDNSSDMWLFFNRINNMLFVNINGPRLKVIFDELLKGTP